MDDYLWQPWRDPCPAWSLSRAYAAQRRRRPPFRQHKGSSQDLLGRCGAVLPEAQHHSFTDFYFSVPRGRRATGKNRPFISQSRTRRSWPRPEHRAVRDDLWHARNCGIYWRHCAWRLLHFMAWTEAGHRSADYYYEPAQCGIRLLE